MKQLHTINSDCVTILQHKIHYYLQIFDLNFSNARAEQNSCVFSLAWKWITIFCQMSRNG